MIVSTDILDRFMFLGYYSRLYIALARRGNTVTWLAGRASQAYPKEMLKIPRFKVEALLQGKTVPILSEFIRQLFGFWKILRSVSQRDVVIFDNVRSPVSLAAPILLLERLISHRPVVLLRITTNPQEMTSILQDLLMRIEDVLSVKLSAVFYDGIFFISPMMAKMYASKYRIPQNKIGIWPPAVDEAFFAKQSTSNVADIRKSLDSNGVLVIYHGHLSAARNLMNTAEAFKLLKDESIKAKLILLGDGPLKEKLKRYVSTNRLGDVIELREPVDYTIVPEYLAACDVGIVPLPDHEWFRYQCPIKLLEYLASGKPVIVSNIPANRWVVSRAPVAIFLEGTSSKDIADGVKRFIAERRNLNPENGRDIARAFSVENMAENLELQIHSFASSG